MYIVQPWYLQFRSYSQICKGRFRALTPNKNGHYICDGDDWHKFVFATAYDLKLSYNARSSNMKNRLLTDPFYNGSYQF